MRASELEIGDYFSHDSDGERIYVVVKQGWHGDMDRWTVREADIRESPYLLHTSFHSTVYPILDLVLSGQFGKER